MDGMMWMKKGAVARAASVCGALLVLASGCAKDEEAPGTTAGTGAGMGVSGMSGGSSGTGGTSGMGMIGECDVPVVADMTCTNTGEENLDCAAPDAVPPFAGPCSPHGPTCHRASNLAKDCALGPDDPVELEFRMTSALPINMPRSTSLPPINEAALNRAKTCDSEQCLLMRTTMPRSGGMEIDGMGTAEIGVGRYNCDGTYSFYGPTAAPDRADVGRTGANRWNPKIATTTVDTTKTGVERSVATGMNPNRQASCSAFYTSGTNEVDWEVCTMGFAFTKINTDPAKRDGDGAYVGGVWERPGEYVVYAPLALNDADVIDALSETFCQLLAFGPVAPDLAATLKCFETPRCMPNADVTVCPWVKLPDSLCPSNEGEAAMWGCHLGDKANVNAEEGYPTDVKCTDEAPSAALGDLDGGQCCDPLGQSTTLPACNAYRIVNAFSGTAVEITKDPKNELQPVCM